MNLKVLGPDDGSRASNNAVVVHGTVRPGASVQVNGVSTRVEPNGRFKREVSLFPGFNFISVVAADQFGNLETAVITVVFPPQPFVLEVTEPKDQSVVTTRLVQVKGLTGSGATARVNGIPVAVNQVGEFSTTVSLDVGANVVEIVANSEDGQELTASVGVIFRP